MTTENWTPLTKEQVEQRFIEMINDYLDLELQYPLPPDLNIKDLKLMNDKDALGDLENLPPEIAAALFAKVKTLAKV